MTTRPSSEHRPVVVALRRSLHAAFADVLLDWSVLGLVDRIHLVDLDSVDVTDPLLPSIVVDEGRRSAGALQSQLASGRRAQGARLVVVEGAAATEQVERAHAGHVLDELTRSLNSAEVTAVRLRLSAAGDPLDLGDGWLGWRNQLLAAENLQAPGMGVTPLVHDDSTPRERLHAVAAVASLTGSWRGQPGAPVDQLRSDPGASWTAVRTFSRHLSAKRIDDALIAQLCDVAEVYPLPLYDGTSAQRVDDEAAAAAEMAAKLVSKHDGLLVPRPRQAPASSPPKSVGLLEGMKLLFVFLGQAIRNAPAAFVDKVVHSVSRNIADGANRMIFGSGDSDFEIVVNGIRPDGTLASWQQVEEASETAAAKLGVPSTHAGGAAFAPVWRDFAMAGMTLLDGGSRGNDLTGPMMGSRPGVVANPDAVVPGITDAFQVPSEVATHLTAQVDPHDVMTQLAVQEKLKAVGEKQTNLRGKVAQVGERLRQWRREVDTSFSGRVGVEIATGMMRTREEISAIAGQLRQAQAQAEVPDSIAAQQARLARSLFTLLAVSLLGVVAAVVVTVIGLIEVLVGVVVAVAVVLAWLLISTLVFIKGQAELFALLHRRRELESRFDLLRRHLADAVGDLRRLTRAYVEYLAWARAFSVFIHSPLGNPTASGDQEQGVGRGFPLNHDFGAAEPDPDSIDEVAARLQRSLFPVGWLSDPWDRFLGQVPGEMGPDGYRIREEPAVLYDDPGNGPDGMLQRWSLARAAETSWGEEAGSLHASVQAAVSDLGLTRQLLSRVQSVDPDTGRPRPLGFDEFFSGLDEAALQAVPSAFDRRVFGPEAQAREVWRVDQDVVFSTDRGLGRTLSVAQFSGGFAGYELAGIPDASGSPAGSAGVGTGPARPAFEDDDAPLT